MNLRGKLVWGGILIVLIPLLFVTAMMWYLIRSQDVQQTQERSRQLLESILWDLDAQGNELLEGMIHFSRDKTLNNKIAIINQLQKKDVLIRQQEAYKTETAVLLESFSRIAGYDVLGLLGETDSLYSFIKIENNIPVIGITSEETEEGRFARVANIERAFEEMILDDWALTDFNRIFTQTLSGGISESIHGLQIFEGRLALRVAVPIRDYHEDAATQQIGSLVGYRFINENLTSRLAHQVQAEVNFFVNSQLYVGTLAEFTEIPPNQLSALQRSADNAQQPYLFVGSDLPFYQTYHPLLRDEDGRAASTLVVSVSKKSTYKHAHGVVALLAGVSSVCVLLIIPITLVFTRRFAEPIHKIAVVSESIAYGHIDQRIEPIRSRDEVGVLSRSFFEMVKYLREMATIAERISHGEIVQEFHPRNEHDLLGKAFQRMIAYFKNITDVAERMLQGNFHQKVAVQSKQDVLGRAFNNIIAQLQALITFVRTESRQLVDVSGSAAQASEDASRNSRIQTESVEMMTATLQEMAGNIENISNNLETQVTALAHVKTSAQHITTSSEDVVNEVEHVSTFTEETASALKTMDNSVLEIHQQVQASVEASEEVVRVAKEGSEQVARLTGEIHAVHGQMELASTSILRLQKESQRIREILSVIQDVMEQTNLLALNASIIAAQAGEHGRAFGVVADEVKALASRTSESTTEIAKFTKTIHAELSDAVNAIILSADSVEEGLQIADKTSQFLDIITTGAEQSSQLIANIAKNVENHRLVSRHVQQAGTEVVRMLERITLLSKEQHEQSAGIHEETAHLTEISIEIQQAIEEQKLSANQSAGTMGKMLTIVQQNAKRAESLAALATKLSSQANTLLDLVEEFSVDDHA